jgi:ATP-dependent protease ClpP protease subunit
MPETEKEGWQMREKVEVEDIYGRFESFSVYEHKKHLPWWPWRVVLVGLLTVAFGLVGFSAWIAFGEEDKPKAQCPKTKMVESCLTCHVIPTFELKEKRPDATYDYPNTRTKILGFEECKTIEQNQRYIGPTAKIECLKGHFFLDSIVDEQVADAFRYWNRHGIKHVIFEIHSPGGNLFSAQRIVSLFQYWQSQGGIVETRIYGFALSAGFHIFVAGNLGQRFVGPQAELMWHEIQSFKFLDYSSPSDKEDEGAVLRHLQDTRNEWLASRSKLTKDELDQKIRKKEFWMSGKEAVEKYGFADAYIGQLDAPKQPVEN